MCRRQLSAVLEREAHGTDTNHVGGAAFFPSGSIHQSHGEYFTGTEGRYVINLADRRNLATHNDPKRLAGVASA